MIQHSSVGRSESHLSFLLFVINIFQSTNNSSFSFSNESAKPGNEPSEAENRDHAHGHHRAERPLINIGNTATAGRAHPAAAKGGVRLRRVQNKLEAAEGREIASLGGRGDGRVGVVDDERVSIHQQRILDVLGLVGLRVPGEGARGGIGHVLRERPGRRGVPARDEHVNGRGRALNVGVVPAPGDVVADLVELRASKDPGGDHDDGAWRVLRVEGLVLCRRGLGTRLRLGAGGGAGAGARARGRVALGEQASVVIGAYGLPLLRRGGRGGCGILVIVCRLRRGFRCRRLCWRFGRCCD